MNSRIPGLRPGGLFDLLLLHQHLRRGLEALVLEQPLHQLAPRVFGVAAEDVAGIARQQRLRLDVNQQRGHVDELARRVHVGLLQLMRVVEKLAGDARNRNVVDVDVLLADQVEQQIERPVVDLAHGDRERRLRSLFSLPQRAASAPAAQAEPASAAARRARAPPTICGCVVPAVRLRHCGSARLLVMRGLFRLLGCAFGMENLVGHGYSRPTAERTCCIVMAARAAALVAPSARMASTSAGVGLKVAAALLNRRQRLDDAIGQPALAFDTADAGGRAAFARPFAASLRSRRPCADRRPGTHRDCRDRRGECAPGR